MRVGIGYDIHRLEEGRELILGGVRIPYKLGLDGHSDADVLLHSIIVISTIKKYAPFSIGGNQWKFKMKKK